MNRNQLIKKLKSINNLPTIPVIAMEVNRLLQNVESPIDQLVNILEKDQSLVAKILRLVNSSFYGFRSKVKSLRHAVTLLGYNTVRNAVITVSVVDALHIEEKLRGFEIDAFWRHSIRVAVMSKYLASKTYLAEPEDAFTAGLLHDIGKVVQASFFSDELTQTLRTANERQTTFFEAEQMLDNAPHHLIGSFLAQNWLLPDALVQSIQHHHSQTERSSQDKLIAIVNIGNCLVHMMTGEPGYTLPAMIQGDDDNQLQAVMKGIQKEQDWLPEVKKKMDAACEFFNKG